MSNRYPLRDRVADWIIARLPRWFTFKVVLFAYFDVLETEGSVSVDELLDRLGAGL